MRSRSFLKFSNERLVDWGGMATFAEVKRILDTLVAGKDIRRMKQRHGGDRFSWDTPEELRNAVALITGTEFCLIAADCIGNGRANETFLIRLLSGPIEEEDLPRMPFRGPFATADQIQVVKDWINGGALDDET